MSEQTLMSPTFPAQPGPVGAGGGALLNRKLLLRKTVDYHASTLHYLESRLWQRDSRDAPLIQPESSYYNVVSLPHGLSFSKVNVVTTKFVKACTNKTRSPIFCTAWVPDGRRLITGAASGEFTLWNGINFNFESIIQAHDCSVRSINWSHNGKWMVTSDDRGFIKYWQINFNNVHTFQAHSEPVRSSSFSPMDNKLATCSDDGTVRVFDFLRCTEEHILRGHGADVKCVHWHPRKSLLASGSKDNQQPVKLWDPNHAHKATVMDIKWNANGNWLATASRDFLIKLYDIRAMKELAILKGHKKDVNTLSWHPVYESVFSSGGSDGAVLFWMVGNDREIGGMESAHEGFVWSLAWHPLGHLLCSGANDHTCKFWCRNRPGEELKDKYNSYHNPFFIGDELDVNLSGMGSDLSRVNGPLIPPPPTDSITLPPPPSTLPWRQNSSDDVPAAGLNTPRVDVPVLGADIIAETFSGSGRDLQNGGRVVNDEFHNVHPDHHSSGNIRPLLDDNPPPHGGYHRDEWGRPGPFGGPHPHHDDFGGSRYSWHRYQPPPMDEERWNHNPFVYRRSDGPPRMDGPSRMDGPPRMDGPSRMDGPRRMDGPSRMDGPPRMDGPSRMDGPPPGLHNYPQPMDEQFRDYHRPPSDRSFGGPPPGERPFRGPPPGEHPYSGPHPSNERPPYGGPPPPGDRSYSGPHPNERPPYGGPHPPLGGERPFGGGAQQYHPQDPRQQQQDQWHGGGPPPPHEREGGNYPQDPRQQQPPPGNQYPLDPRDPRSFRSHPPPPFGHSSGGSGSLNYRPPDSFHHDDSRHRQYTDEYHLPNRDGGYHGDEMGGGKMDGPVRDPRFERRGGGGWREGVGDSRRRDDYNDRRRDVGGRVGGRGRDDDPRHRSSDDRDSPSMKRSKRDNSSASNDVNRSSSSRGHSSNKNKK